MWSLLLATPFLLAAPQTQGWTFAGLLAIGGLFLQSTLPVNVSFGQALAPHSAATVSSLMMGVAWGTGGMLVPVTGMVADALGLPTTLTLLAALPLCAAALATQLPGGATSADARRARRGERGGHRSLRRRRCRAEHARSRVALPGRGAALPYTGVVARSPYSRVSYQFGPGPVTPAVKALLIANGVLFLRRSRCRR